MKYVYFFGNDQTEGNKDMKELLGGKGANLAEMARLGVPVPPGFTITTQACAEYNEQGKKFSVQILSEIKEHLARLEESMGKRFGDDQNPLLLSVRSGAAVSMPGMMDTVLNLGLNDESVKGLAKSSGNERFALDSYRRFIQMFGNVVMGVPHHAFESVLTAVKEKKGVVLDTDLDTEDLRVVIVGYKEAVLKHAGKSFPTLAFEQLQLSIEAVFLSWDNPRAVAYRRLNDIKGLKGTGVNVQAMVFGNLGETSGTGVCFSRNPSTGENVFYGEYLMNAQGEDVVAGIRTPLPISQLSADNPAIYSELVGLYQLLEKHYREMQDMEFTIEQGKLYMLQTRTGKRTAHAAVRIAVEMVEEGLIDKKTAVMRVSPASLDQLLHKQLDPRDVREGVVIATGLPASPGAAVGSIVFCAVDAVELKSQGENVILVRNETSPEDLMGMDAAVGIFTARGGMTSHAAVVARGMGKCCVCGCSEARIDEEHKRLVIGNQSFTQGDVITLDGGTGKVYAGTLGLVDPELSGAFGTLMNWADEFRTLMVRTNADTPVDAQVAMDFGAQGIGLCRTEHMFFEQERIRAVREMILAPDKKGREAALEKILPYQQQDFFELFKVMKGKPITIRLLDPPLHEFLPTEEKEIARIAQEMGVTDVELRSTIDSLHETNPMLGHRGCRLGIAYPEITRMQSKAIFCAAQQAVTEGFVVNVEVMIPLVGNVLEFVNQKKIVIEVARKVLGENSGVKYLVGTMIEVPRAALTAEKIACEADFFSFGTNDLTQMTLGISRDDAAKFLGVYVEKGLLEYDPFQVLDQEGVGMLVKMAVERGRAANPTLKLGICGEHGGEPRSIEFCHRAGLDYVSCSPYRVPVARLAAAQTALRK